MIEEEKICFLTEDPIKHLNENEWWSIRYNPIDLYDTVPDINVWYTSVTRNTCPKIDELKKGSKIIVNILNQKIINVKPYFDPLDGLYILGQM